MLYGFSLPNRSIIALRFRVGTALYTFFSPTSDKLYSYKVLTRHRFERKRTQTMKKLVWHKSNFRVEFELKVPIKYRELPTLGPYFSAVKSTSSTLHF